MLKKLTSILLLVIMLACSVIPANAASFDYANTQSKTIYKSEIYKSKEIIFKKQIEVTEKGGVFQVGFATIKFPKNFIDKKQLPIRLDVEISAVEGVPGIEFTPDLPQFKQPVTVIVHPYKGLLYDHTSKTNIPVRIRNHKLYLEHFSRYAFS
ncbi:MAG TPA: hypothetical protein DD738_13030 [Ruminiclostridium sp.]|nr:hypothetical protein [Ruminiclostridium sp.]